jgi:hypothetical protein
MLRLRVKREVLAAHDASVWVSHGREQTCEKRNRARLRSWRESHLIDRSKDTITVMLGLVERSLNIDLL